MKTLIIFGFIMALAFARNAPGRSPHIELHIAESAPVKEDMNIKEFEEKFHEDFANPEDEAKAAEALAEHEAQINKQHEDFIQGKANFDEGNYSNTNIVFTCILPVG